MTQKKLNWLDVLKQEVSNPLFWFIIGVWIGSKVW